MKLPSSPRPRARLARLRAAASARAASPSSIATSKRRDARKVRNLTDTELRHAVGRFGEQPVRLVETAEHGQEAIPVRENAAPLDLRVLVEPAQALLHRRRAV